MLRLDKTVSRIVPLHHDEEEERRAYWRSRTPAQRREIIAYLRQQRQVLLAFSQLKKDE